MKEKQQSNKKKKGNKLQKQNTNHSMQAITYSFGTNLR